MKDKGKTETEAASAGISLSEALACCKKPLTSISGGSIVCSSCGAKHERQANRELWKKVTQ